MTETTDSTEPTTDTAERDQAAEALPLLALLDQTADALQQDLADGKKVTADRITTYEQQAAHARHLLAGVSPQQVIKAEKEHSGDGDKGFATRALDHAAHPRNFEPTPPPADNSQGRDRDDEEIEL